MTPEELNTAIYHKMEAEQDSYRDWLLTLPPDEILQHAYEYAVRQDILFAMEDLELQPEQCQALMKSPCPVADVLRDFEKLELGYMETLRDCIEGRADKLKYGALFEQNNDFVGWISIDETSIHYPVMQTPDNPDYYLKHGFDKEYSEYGCPYVQEDCDVQKPSDNLVIYGHHMKNGSMFAHLDKFKSESFWSKHKTIAFNTLTERQEDEIVAVFRTVVYTDSPDAFKYYRFVDAGNANEFDSFIAKCKELSFYDTGVTAAYGDKLITLSTCEYSRNNSRLVVVAKRIVEGGDADAAQTYAEASAESQRPD